MTIEEVISLLDDTFDSVDIQSSQLEGFCFEHGLIYRHGVTKFCLYDPHWDKVLKFTRFRSVIDDYCTIEYENFLNAKKIGIDKIFLPVERVATLSSGIHVYAQTRFSSDFEHLPRPVYHSIKTKVNATRHGKIFHKSYGNVYQSYHIEDIWYARAYQIYGKRFMKELEAFTNRYRIGDLHSENVGFLGKMPIILDFSGYHG